MGAAESLAGGLLPDTCVNSFGTKVQLTFCFLVLSGVKGKTVLGITICRTIAAKQPTRLVWCKGRCCTSCPLGMLCFTWCFSMHHCNWDYHHIGKVFLADWSMPTAFCVHKLSGVVLVGWSFVRWNVHITSRSRHPRLFAMVNPLEAYHQRLGEQVWRCRFNVRCLVDLSGP